MKGLFILAIFCLVGFPVLAQTKYTISGFVKDEKSGEELIGATVFIKKSQDVGTITNAYGFYSITIPEGNFIVTAQFIGYEAKSATIDLKQNTKLNFTLTKK